jgi:hypothetical protein
LEGFGKVAVVAVRADGDAAADRGVEVARVALPLFQRVAFEKQLVETRADLGEDGFLGIFRIGDNEAVFGEVAFEFRRGRRFPDEFLEGIEVDGEGPEFPLGERLDRVIDGVPAGEGGEVVEDAFGVGAEIVRAIIMDQDAGLVVGVVSVPREVWAAVNDRADVSRMGEPVRGDQSRKSGSCA